MICPIFTLLEIVGNSQRNKKLNKDSINPNLYQVIRNFVLKSQVALKSKNDRGITDFSWSSPEKI